ncbi:MAG: Maf family protein [Moraxellaceae bacterium]
MSGAERALSPALVLASTSPRRRELLAQLGLRFDVARIDVDERRLTGESPEAYVRRLAEDKARAGLMAVTPGTVVVAADTTVALGDDVLGKPASFAEAEAMWQRLAGGEHRVLTGVAVAVRDAAGEARLAAQVVATRVRFRAIAAQEMQAYWASGEPADKAGGYAIQGRGAVFVTGIEGSYSNVVGLPLAETADLLAGFGVSVWEHAPHV